MTNEYKVRWGYSDSGAILTKLLSNHLLDEQGNLVWYKTGRLALLNIANRAGLSSDPQLSLIVGAVSLHTVCSLGHTAVR